MDKYPVVIVGGGPVGLLLALRLTQLNVKCFILEKRTIRKTHSKAIGIHPPSMEILQAVNEKMLNDIIEKSVVVKDGICMGTGKDNILGSLRLDVTKKPFNFVLSCPQDVSESILEQYLLKMNPNAIQKGATVTSVLQTQDYAQVVYRDASGNIQTQKASFVIGCDGKESQIRKTAGIKMEGSTYEDTFIMGDFDDNTSYGSTAALFLSDYGLVECFPLPGNRRRWVVSTDDFIPKPTVEQIVQFVKHRTNYDISKQKNYMVSGYHVQGFVAEKYFVNRIIIAGDAAHVCSPLGGQGMNMGWFDAYALATALYNTIKLGKPTNYELLKYEKEQKRKAKAVVHRAEMNMWFGRKPNSKRHLLVSFNIMFTI